MFDPVILKPSKEQHRFTKETRHAKKMMSVAILLLVPMAVAAPVEVPVAEEFHEAMMSTNNTTETFNPRGLDVVDELDVTGDTIMGYPNESKEFFEEIRNGDDNGVNLAAVMMPYIVLFIALLIGVMAAVCMLCCWAAKYFKKWKKNTKKDIDDTEPKANDDEGVNATQGTLPSDISDYSINVYRKVEYVPEDRSYFMAISV